MNSIYRAQHSAVLQTSSAQCKQSAYVQRSAVQHNTVL